MTTPLLPVDPAQVGMDAGRLARIDAHLARYVDDGRLPGCQVLVTRRGEVAHFASLGAADLEAGRPVRDDTVFRIYSMTKPVTTVAAMALWERGAFMLNDPVSRFLPSFGQSRVFRIGTAAKPVTVPATEPVRMWHLLTHMSGLTYGFHHVDAVDEMYRAQGFDLWVPPGCDLAQATDAWAALPLVLEPGTGWNYGVSTDVLGRVLEVVTGKPLDVVLQEEVLGPLGMTDTAFWAEPAAHDRLAALYALAPGLPEKVRFDQLGDLQLSKPAFLSGGGGLVSTTADYHRFTQMLLRGGELDGVRVLGPRTLRYMSRNHIPGGADLQSTGRPVFAEVRYDGVGFGLGFAVMVDPVVNRQGASLGEISWGGLASTAFWVDPVEQVTVVFMTQLMPSSSYPIRTELRQLVSQAIVD